MSESIAEGLSVVGLVVGFPLLLLGLMLSLEKLESWGLREGESERAAPQIPERDRIDDAVEQLSLAASEIEQTPSAGTSQRGP